jgi:hypothetical protein
MDELELVSLSEEEYQEEFGEDHPEGVVEFYDSRNFHLLWLLLSAFILMICVGAGGAYAGLGFLLFIPHVLYALKRLVTRRVRIRISETGILDQSMWYSPGFLPWDDILDVRKRNWGLIEIQVRDQKKLLKSQGFLKRLAMRRFRFRGYSPVLVTPWALEDDRDEILQALQDGLEEFNLLAIRREKALEGGTPEEHLEAGAPEEG